MTKRSAANAEQPGWNYIIDADSIGGGVTHVKVAAEAEDCAKLAEHLGLPEIANMRMDVEINRCGHNKAMVHVRGTVKADVTQLCVVTREPVRSHILEEFEAWFADRDVYISLDKARHDRQGRANADTEVHMMEEREDPEPIVNGKINLGDLAGQYLSLGLEPYPQVEGAIVPDVAGVTIVPEGTEVPSPLRRNPFEALKKLKKDSE